MTVGEPSTAQASISSAVVVMVRLKVNEGQSLANVTLYMQQQNDRNKIRLLLIKETLLNMTIRKQRCTGNKIIYKVSPPVAVVILGRGFSLLELVRPWGPAAKGLGAPNDDEAGTQILEATVLPGKTSLPSTHTTGPHAVAEAGINTQTTGMIFNYKFIFKFDLGINKNVSF